MNACSKAFLFSTLVGISIITTPLYADVEGDYTYEVADGQATVTKFNSSYSGALTIPDYLGGYPVTGIGQAAFYLCKDVTDITVPAGVTSIGDYAFGFCGSLTSIALPVGLTSIGGSAFWNCTSLTNTEIPSSVTSIGDSAFRSCTSLISIEIPSGVSSIGIGVFEDCTSLTSIALPAGLTSIGGSAFRNCTSLTNIEIPSGVTSIGDWAFRGCANLERMLFAGDPPQLGGNVFLNTKLNVVCYTPAGNGWGSTYGGIPAKLWNPELSRLEPGAGGAISGMVTGEANIPVVIQVSSDLTSGEWVDLGDFTSLDETGSYIFQEPPQEGAMQRFYRVGFP